MILIRLIQHIKKTWPPFNSFINHQPMMKLFLTPLIALGFFHHQSINGLDYPGTNTRPILSAKEASNYTLNHYLSGWEPKEIVVPNQPDYIVKTNQSIQVVVNQAITNGSNASRIYIKIEPGHYMETVYIQTDIPLTIYGDKDQPANVHIMVTLSALTTVSDYQTIVNPNGTRYRIGDPAWDIYNSCATKNSTTLGTFCTPVFWVNNSNFQLSGVTVHNGATDAQAIAIRTSGDQLQLNNNIFKSYQDAVALGISDEDSNSVERVMVDTCYIEGQVDYVFGGAAAVFNNVTFYTLAIKNTTQTVLAPDTAPNHTYGFLVINSNITGDPIYLGSNENRLARAWDHGLASAALYVPGVSPNGELVIRDSYIDNVINVTAPYAPAAGSARPFTTDIESDRNLNNNNHNRLWEYNNTGPGAGGV